MKITANQNLIPYFQPSRDALPADQSDGKTHPELNRRAVAHGSLGHQEQPHRYYIKEDLENSTYNAKKSIIPQYRKHKGVMIDVYA